MTIEELIKYFSNGYEFHIRTGLSRVTYHSWKKKGYIPIASQQKLEELTQGELKADYGRRIIK